MTEDLEARMAGLRRRLQRRRLLVLWLPGVFAAAGVVAGAGVYVLQASLLESQVKADYQETWCETFGASKYSAESHAAWFEFIDRNREYLQSRESLLVEDPRSGAFYLGLEYELQMLNVFTQGAAESVGFIFAGPHDELGSGKNEFGKGVPLPCG